jgi:hypothetical protein
MAVKQEEALKLADIQMSKTGANYQLSSIERQNRQGRDVWFIAFEQKQDDALMDGTISFFLVDVETGEVTLLPHP